MCEVLDRAENKGIKKGKEDAHLEAIKYFGVSQEMG